MVNYINPRAFNRQIKGYKDKHFKQVVADNNCTNEIKLRWLYARLKMVVKGKDWIEIEKQQIIDAAQWMPKPYDKIEFIPELAEQYYNQTFKQD